MGILFDQNQFLAKNQGMAWNFFHLLGCGNVQLHQEVNLVTGCITAQLPNGRYVRYTEFRESDMPKLKEVWQTDYNSSTTTENGIPVMALHFNMQTYLKTILMVRCGTDKRTGSLVVFKSDLGWSSCYAFEISTTPFDTL